MTTLPQATIALPAPIIDSPTDLAVNPIGNRSRLADYYELTKPRMNMLVVITTVVGYYMGVWDHTNWPLLLHTIFGTALTAAGASVLNQYVERSYDALMTRTANRPLPAGRIAPLEALAFGCMLGICGVIYLFCTVNGLTASLGALTLLFYVFLYTPLKRYTSLCTIVGAVPGALPPVMGYTAARGVIAPEAMTLFAILFIWQMPHFLAIAILYSQDYARGGFKMLPVVDPTLDFTGRQIVLYSLSLIPISLMPAALHMDRWTYVCAAIVLGLGFTAFGLRCALNRTRLDARRLFIVSIIYLPLLLGLMIFDKV